MRLPIVILIALVLAAPLAAQTRPRGRDLGIPFPGTTGPNNAITDVAGIAVGHITLIEGEGKLIPGKGPIRTGVTAILPRPKGNWDPVFAATFNLNGNGDMTGINWIKESGFMEGPILLTGTHSVGTVRDAAIQWQLKNGRKFVFTYPIVAETFDFMNDANGEHVKPMHALQALDNAKPGRVQEGAVGGGTGMGCNGFKGGIGTSSRLLPAESGGYTIGVLVQCNYGGDLRILGVPIRQEIGDLRACTTLAQPLTREWTRGMPSCRQIEAATTVLRHKRMKGVVQSSLSLRQTRRFFRINWSDSRVELEWGLDGWAVGPAIHPAISFWLSRQQTPERVARKERLH
jgi:L-aminopeptidase/D-esterase-like protein